MIVDPSCTARQSKGAYHCESQMFHQSPQWTFSFNQSIQAVVEKLMLFMKQA
eukprot:m.579 g.579  ORF g.579 m.579 type:complete len:52 (+) comp809_c0_seq1:283-438(+)